MNLSIRFLFLLALIPLSSAITGCSREQTPSNSLIVLQLPSNKMSKSLNSLSSPWAEGSTSKVCYAINVIGSGISASNSACGPSKGVFSSFVDGSSGQLSLNVPTGTDRTVEVYTYIASPNSNCPSWNWSCEKGNDCNLYKVASVSGVDMSQSTTQVSVTISFPGWDQHVVSQSSTPLMCSGSLRAILFENGDVRSPSYQLFSPNPSFLGNEAIIYSQGDIIDQILSGGESTDTNLPSVPPHLTSVSRKPDSGEYYGSLASGKIVKINTSTGSLVDLESACPFNSCSLPLWSKSMSLGLGRNVFFSDYGGAIYTVKPDGAISKLSDTLPINARGFSFF